MTTLSLPQYKERPTFDQRTQDEKTFGEFIGKNGLSYEKILMNEHFGRVEAILRGNNPPPYEVEIQPLSLCNAGCKTCWAHGLAKVPNEISSLEAMDRVIGEVLDFKRDGYQVDIVKFCGSTGEPTLNPLTPYAIEKVAGKRYLRLFTNGITLGLNKNKDDYLTTFSKINRLNLSLDAANTRTLYEIKPGAKKEGVRLEEILEAAAKLREKSHGKCQIEVGYVISNYNYSEIEEAAKKISEMNAANAIRFRIDMTDRSVSVNHGEEIIRSLKRAKEYEKKDFRIISMHSEEQIEESEEGHFGSKGCGLGCFTSRLWACIGPNSAVYPCGHITFKDTPHYGYLLEKSFPEIWDGSQRKEVLKKLPMEKCTICSPFSLRTNQFMSFLSTLPIERVQALKKSMSEVVK